MKDIVFTLEFNDDYANDRANEYLNKGWLLLHVGTKTLDVDGEAIYNPVYVLGANQQQYEEYKEEIKNDPISELLNE